MDETQPRLILARPAPGAVGLDYQACQVQERKHSTSSSRSMQWAAVWQMTSHNRTANLEKQLDIVWDSIRAMITTQAWSALLDAGGKRTPKQIKQSSNDDLQSIHTCCHPWGPKHVLCIKDGHHTFHHLMDITCQMYSSSYSREVSHLILSDTFQPRTTRSWPRLWDPAPSDTCQAHTMYSYPRQSDLVWRYGTMSRSAQPQGSMAVSRSAEGNFTTEKIAQWRHVLKMEGACKWQQHRAAQNRCCSTSWWLDWSHLTLSGTFQPHTTYSWPHLWDPAPSDTCQARTRCSWPLWSLDLLQYANIAWSAPTSWLCHYVCAQPRQHEWVRQCLRISVLYY